MLKRVTLAGATLALLSANAFAQTPPTITYQQCTIPSNIVASIQAQLVPVANLPDGNGGIFKPNMMWSAIVDRFGTVCSVINNNASITSPKPGDAWPGSRDIAMAKAYTANAFSNNRLAISTANLYAPTQPGGSLYGLNNSNPFNPEFNPQGTGINRVAGGIITFGGGVALYLNGQVIGGLGVSGDSSCADHAIAYRMRHNSGFDKIPGGPNSKGTDNIEYPSGTAAPSGFQQPHCFPSDITP